MKHLFTLAFALCLMSAYAQDDIMNELESEQKPKKEYVSYTFKTTRVISAHSVEVVKKGALDFRISHRFGDIASSGNDHIHSMFGFDQAADILFAFEYGVTDDLTIGVGRAKGAGPLRELWNANIKYRVLKQTRDFKNPFTITLFANASISSMRNSGDPTSLSYFPKGGGYANFANRMAYTVQGLFGIKATKWLSVQFTPTFVWHNNVAYNDNNYLFLMGFSARAKFTQRAGFIFEYFLPLTKPGVGGREYFPMVRGMKNAMYYPALNVGFEFETGGHIFHINVTNTRGMLEQDFLAYNTANWAQGEFRLGFTISRTFQLGKKGKGEKYWKKGSVEDAKNNKQ